MWMCLVPAGGVSTHFNRAILGNFSSGITFNYALEIWANDTTRIAKPSKSLLKSMHVPPKACQLLPKTAFLKYVTK